MPRFSQDFIEEVKNHSDIVDVVSQYVRLTRKGGRYWGLCPFHSEKTGSFSVVPDEQFYYCFGCHAGGNVFAFIEHLEHTDFVGAVEHLAERAHLEIPAESAGPGQTGPSAQVRRQQREELTDAGSKAARFYYDCLMSEQGKEALAYLRRRGLDMKMIRRFGLGYAPDGWDNLKSAMLKLGVKEKTLLDAGLLQKKNNHSYDAFRNRIIFPIFSERGSVIGFGGRVMDKSLPKYLNSPDTPVFNKRKNLYGLSILHKQHDVSAVIICEGYMDTLAYHQAGFSTAVATLGTALTEEQAKLLTRYTSTVILSYDGDNAGQKATLRGMEILRNAGLQVKVAVMPDGLDPDEVLRQRGRDALQQILDDAMPLNAYHLMRLEQGYNLRDPADRGRYVSQCCSEVLAAIEDDVERSVYIQQLHLKTGISEVDIRRQTERIRAGEEAETQTPSVTQPAADEKFEQDNRSSAGDAQISAESYIIMQVLMKPGWNHGLTEEDFAVPDFQNLFRWIRSYRETQPGKQKISDMMSEAPESIASLLARLASAPDLRDPSEEVVADCMKQLRRNRLDRRISEIRRRLTEVPEEERTELKKQLNTLLIERRQI